MSLDSHSGFLCVLGACFCISGGLAGEELRIVFVMQGEHGGHDDVAVVDDAPMAAARNLGDQPV